MLTAVLTLCDHVSGCPSGDAAQSLARMRPPISPPPASHAGLAQLPPIIEVTRLSKREVQFSRRVGLTAPFVQGNKSTLGPEKRKLPAPRNHVALPQNRTFQIQHNTNSIQWSSSVPVSIAPLK